MEGDTRGWRSGCHPPLQTMNINELHLFQPIRGSDWYAVESSKPSSNAPFGGSIVFACQTDPTDNNTEFTIRIPRATIAACYTSTELLAILDKRMQLHLGETMTRRPTMLETVLKLYVTSMTGDVRSPMPHLFGPPGCGKSTIVQKVADMVGVQMHTINVSRISPLELEGVQMPDKENTKLTLLTATQWSQLHEGDILLLDEFLRGFPEVYNGLLDILTAREVGGFKLPKVFIIGASNTVVAYDPALEDRLLHIPALDPRKARAEHTRIAKMLQESIGLSPDMANSAEMENVLTTEVHPTYQILDQLKNHLTVAGSSLEGHSVRNLIGQAKLREVQSSALKELIDMNNVRAMRDSKPQYVVLLNGIEVPSGYVKAANELRGNPKLTQLQAINLELNLQLIQMEEIRKEEDQHDDDTF